MYIPIFSKTWNLPFKPIFQSKSDQQEVLTMSDFPIRSRTDYFVVHCSATRPINPITVDILRQWHIARGFGDIGYHYFIDTSGNIHKGRVPDNSIGAGVKGHNDNTLHICLEGGLDNRSGFPNNTYTRAQFLSLNSLIHLLLKNYPHAETLGHRDLSPDSNHDGIIESTEFLKACPCFDAVTWARVNNLPYPKAISEHKQAPLYQVAKGIN